MGARLPIPTPEQGSSLQRRTDDTHVDKVYTYTSTWLYICIQLCTARKISKYPSDPYEAVLRNPGAYKNIFLQPQHQGHHHCNKTIFLKTQQNGPSFTFTFTSGCDSNNHPIVVGTIALRYPLKARQPLGCRLTYRK
jgi:hypothetical protein